ncbi:response regulator transcription factor, partial [Patescibacteria group bacterium]
NQYDLILIDLLLPDIHGLTICKKLAEENNPASRLVLTAKSDLKLKLEAFKNDVDDYLTKPFSFEELLARIKTIMRRKGQNKKSSDKSKHSRIKLDRETREVFIDQKKIQLSFYEFLLLDYLLQNQGKVLSRTKILENVWGYNEDPFTNVVDVYVCNLRKKLVKNDCEDLIQTVRNIGYKLVDG